MYQGGGFDQTSPIMNLILGLGVHKGLEILLLTDDLEEAIRGQQEEWVRLTDGYSGDFSEGSALIEALVRGWARARWEDFKDEFQILMVEKEVKALLAPNITLNARADAVIRSKVDGSNFVLNWKTSGNINDWSRQWDDEVQAWTEALAMEDALGEKIQGVIFEGLFKGAWRDGKNHSPLIYGWRLPMGGGRFVYSAKYRRFTREEPWLKFPLWLESPPTGDGLSGWISWIPQDVLEAQFVRSTPILKNDDVVQNWVRQVVRQQTDISRMLEDDVTEGEREDFFTQHFSKMNCPSCPFKKVCKLQSTIEGMLENGELRRRIDHHAVENQSSIQG